LNTRKKRNFVTTVGLTKGVLSETSIDILRTVTATDFSRSLFADSGVAETVA